jgi:Fe2+ transport system protein FeoA
VKTPLRIITEEDKMNLSLRYAKRGIPQKVVGQSEHICAFGLKQLANFNIKEGAVLEIDPAFVSQVLLGVNGKDVLLGYEYARMVVIEDKRITDLKPGNSVKITAMEGGYEANWRFKELGLSEGIEVTLKAYPALGNQYVRLQGTKIVKEDMKELLSVPPVAYFMVDVAGTEKQVSLMVIGEKGKITKVIADRGKREELDREWIKEGNEIEIMHRLDPESVPLMVRVGDKSHVVGAGLAEKIFVQEL